MNTSQIYRPTFFRPARGGLMSEGFWSNTQWVSNEFLCPSRDTRKFLLRRLSRIISSASIIFQHRQCHVTAYVEHRHRTFAVDPPIVLHHCARLPYVDLQSKFRFLCSNQIDVVMWCLAKCEVCNFVAISLFLIYHIAVTFRLHTRSSAVAEIPRDALYHVKSGLRVAQCHWK